MNRITIDNYGTVFSQLAEKIQALEQSGDELVMKTAKDIRTELEEIRQGGDQLKKDNEVLKIGVVGQVKAGKSSFLNSLFFNGENVLPRASTPMTAGLTVLKYGDTNQFEVEYYNNKEWETFEDNAKYYDQQVQNQKLQDPSLTDEEAAKLANIDSRICAAKELVANCSRSARANIQETSKVDTKDFAGITDLQNILEDYVGANGNYTSIVKCLTIKMHDERLKDIEIVDTPGVNDPVLSREQRTREFLRGCHGVFFLSYSGRFFDSTDVNFLTERIGDQGIGTVVLIASKFDSVLQDLGTKYRDDLSSAIEDCQRTLKKQYRNNITTSNFKGSDPIVDFSSGIGFSISQKPEGQWDSIEAHVVKQMKLFYPSYFSSDEDIRNTFYALSQMDDIREKYLDKTFKDNKDKIIKDKVNAYFLNAGDNIGTKVQKEKEKLQTNIDALNSGDIESLQQRKDVLGGIIVTIKGSLDSILSRATERAEKYQKDILNSFHFDYKIPVTEENETFSRRGTVFSDNIKTFNCTYKTVDINDLLESATQKVQKSLQDISQSWENKNRDVLKFIRDSISEIITENEQKDDSGKVDGRILRNILEEILDGMSNKATIDVQSNVFQLKDALTARLQGKELRIELGACEENTAQNKVRKQAEKLVQEIREEFEIWSKSIYQAARKSLEQAREDSINVLISQTREFITRVKDGLAGYLSDLEKDLNDKTAKLQIRSAALNELNKIEQEL